MGRLSGSLATSGGNAEDGFRRCLRRQADFFVVSEAVGSGGGGGGGGGTSTTVVLVVHTTDVVPDGAS